MLDASGLYRLGLGHRISQLHDAHTFIPAIGQGALGIECKSTNTSVQKIISSLNDQPSQACIAAERAVNQRLCGSCQSAIGAYAEYVDNHQIILRCTIGDSNGHLIHSTVSGPADNAQHIGISAANELIAQGARAML